MNISGMVKLEYVGVFITGTDPPKDFCLDSRDSYWVAVKELSLSY